MKFPTWLKHMFTEADNHTADIGCVILAMVALAWVSCGVYSVFILKQPFSWAEAGTGGGLIMGGAAILFKWKQQSSGKEDQS